MTKFIVLFALLGVGIITLGSQSVEAKPFLKPSFFVLTTKAPLNGQSSVFGGGFQLTNLIMPKIRLILNLLQSTTSKKSSLLGGGLFGGSISSSVTTTSKTPDFETDFEAESTTKYSTTEHAVTEYNYGVGVSVDLTSNKEHKNNNNDAHDIAISINSSKPADKDSVWEESPENVVKNYDQTLSVTTNNDHAISHHVADSDDESYLNTVQDNHSQINTNNDVTDSKYIYSAPTIESVNEDGYSHQNNIETNKIPVEPIKSNKYLPPAPQ